MPQPQNQRSALSLVGGIVYVAYGGHVGDCGPYHGWVVGINAANPAMKGGWATGGQGEGIWAAGGMASDGTGCHRRDRQPDRRAAAPRTRTARRSSRITGMGTRADTWYPSRWMAMDSSRRRRRVGQPGLRRAAGRDAVEDGPADLEGRAPLHPRRGRARRFGGAQGRLRVRGVSGMSIHGTPTAYKTAHGPVLRRRRPPAARTCARAASAARALVAVQIPPANPPVADGRLVLGDRRQRVDRADRDDDRRTSNAIVWFINNANTLKALDGDTGAQILTAAATRARASSAGRRRSRSTTRSSSAATATSARGRCRSQRARLLDGDSPGEAADLDPLLDLAGGEVDDRHVVRRAVRRVDLAAGAAAIPQGRAPTPSIRRATFRPATSMIAIDSPRPFDT